MRALMLLLSLAQDPSLPEGAEGRLRVGDGKVVVISLAISPDGSLLASGDREGVLRIWKLPSRELLLKEARGSSGIGSLVFAPDNKTLYLAVWHDGTYAFDIATRDLRKIPAFRSSGNDALSLSPDGSLLAATDTDRNLYLFRPDGDKSTRSALPGMPDAKPDRPYITSMGRSDTHHSTAFSPDGKSVCWGWDGGTIRIYDVQTRKPQVVLPGHNDNKLAHSVAFSPDGKFLASRGYDSAVKVWDIAEKKTVFERSARGGLGLAFSPDGSLLAWGEGDGAVRFAEIGKKAVGELKGSSGEVRSVLFSADKKHLISGVDNDGSVLFWKMEEVRRRVAADAPREEKPATEGTLLGTIDESGSHHGLAFSSDARRAAWVLRDPDGELLILNGQPVTGKSRSITGLAFSPDGRRVACIAASAAKQMNVLLDGVRGDTFPSIRTPVFSSDGKRVAYSVEDSEGRERAVVDGKAGAPFNVLSWISFSDDSLHVAYVGTDPDRKLDVVILDGKETGITASRIQYLVFRPDRRAFAYATYGTASSRIEVDGKNGPEFDWTGLPTFSRNGKTLAYFGVRKSSGFVVVNEKALEIPIGVARELVLSPDGNRWACAGDKQVIVDGVPGTPYEAVGRPVFSPDGKKIAHAAKQVGRWRLVVVGGPTSEEFDEISPPQFAQDGLEVAFGARDGRKVWRRVLQLK